MLNKTDWQNAIDATKRWKDEWKHAIIGLTHGLTLKELCEKSG